MMKQSRKMSSTVVGTSTLPIFFFCNMLASESTDPSSRARESLLVSERGPSCVKSVKDAWKPERF
jgi:hypothetical protein